MSMASEWNVAVAFKRLEATDTASCVGVPHAVFHFVAPTLYSHYGHCEIVLRTPSGIMGDRVPEVTGATHHRELVNTVYTIDRTRPVHTRTDPRPYYQFQEDPLSPWTVCCFTATPRELTRLHEFLEAQVGKPFHRAGVGWAGIWAAPVYTPKDSYTYDQLTRKLLCHCTATVPELKDLPSKKAWFCSELVAAALVYARLCHTTKLEPRSCTPDYLWRYLHEHLQRPRQWS